MSAEIDQILLSGTPQQKSRILQQLISSKDIAYKEKAKEILLFEEDPDIRSLLFLYIARVANEYDIETLLEAIYEEDDQVTKSVMINTLAQLTEKLGIEIEIENPAPQPARDEFQWEEDQKEKRVIEARKRVLKLIFDLKPERPISLYKMAEIAKVTPSSLEKFLTDLCAINPEAGIYLKDEQVFIKKPQTLKAIMDREIQKVILCVNCGYKSNKFPCPKCGQGMQCITCRLPLSINDKLIKCPKCQMPSHDSHFKEWVKIKGTCPNCKENIQL